MARWMIRTALAFSLACGASAALADASPGRAKARACAVCHGEFGISVLPSAPNLAGQPAFYLVEQLKAYRSGKRANEIMGVIAKPLTDAEMTELSAWFASIQIEAKPPQ
ncbi:MAG TPA: cytochrome c [Usitatibacteraceae bacterium]|nr:cytochrome c [Usitatibacteraceae bacterium]